MAISKHLKVDIMSLIICFVMRAESQKYLHPNDCGEKYKGCTSTMPVILLPLRPASLTHKNPQGRKIVHGTRPVGCKE